MSEKNKKSVLHHKVNFPHHFVLRFVLASNFLEHVMVRPFLPVPADLESVVIIKSGHSHFEAIVKFTRNFDYDHK